jgi:hypothetical protein
MIRTFLDSVPVFGWIPDFIARYPVRPYTGYPAGYQARAKLILLNIFSFSSNMSRKKACTTQRLV